MQKQFVHYQFPLGKLFPARPILLPYSLAYILYELLQLLERVFDKLILDRVEGFLDCPYALVSAKSGDFPPSQGVSRKC